MQHSSHPTRAPFNMTRRAMVCVTTGVFLGLLAWLAVLGLQAQTPPPAASVRPGTDGRLAYVSDAADPTSRPAPGGSAPSAPQSVVWTIDNLTSIGGHAVTVVGSPRVVDTPAGKAVEFNGRTDSLLLDVNPLAGLQRFTVEVIFSPAGDGPAEQRFLHIEEIGSGNRAMMETRILPGGLWCLDTFLKSGDASLTLLDRVATHTTDAWHVVALTYDGQRMTHYVNGVRDAGGLVAISPFGQGRTSIGVRQNLVYWFKGRMALIRVTSDALPSNRLLARPARLPAQQPTR